MLNTHCVGTEWDIAQYGFINKTFDTLTPPDNCWPFYHNNFIG